MLGFVPIGFLPLSTVVDDGLHGEPALGAIELDSADADLVWLVEVDAIDLDEDQA